MSLHKNCTLGYLDQNQILIEGTVRWCIKCFKFRGDPLVLCVELRVKFFCSNTVAITMYSTGYIALL